MSRKPFVQMSRQGRLKRIKRENMTIASATRGDNQSEEEISYYHQEAAGTNNLPSPIVPHSSNSPPTQMPCHADNDNPVFRNTIHENTLSESDCKESHRSDSPKTQLPCYAENNNNSVFHNIIREDPQSDSDHEECHTHDNDIFVDHLRNWAIKYQVTHVVISALLLILKSHTSLELPTDARTLLKTPVTVITRLVEPGQYSHIGLQKQLRNIWGYVTESVNELCLLINIDGLPLFKSSSTEFWPILGLVSNIPSIKSIVFPIGVYCGTKKPFSCTSFLQEFVTEAVHLINNGLDVNGKNIKVIVKGFVCDAPAKAFLLAIKGHTGYYSCTKCKQSGVYMQNRMTFPEIDAPPRTHQEFLEMHDEDFHNSSSPLTEIPGINFINSFPLDYMHLVCLGVVRTLLYLWMFGPVPLKLPRQILNSISTDLVSFAGHIPSEFNRKPRSLDDVRRWKATEFRQFLLYTGPVILLKLKSSYLSHYNNFLSLTVAMTILLNPEYCLEYNEYAKNLLKHFVKTFTELYGPQFATHNLHGLTHISDDVVEFGALDCCSAFPFENFLQVFKRSIRKGDKPLQQIIKRFGEIANTNHWFKNASPCNSSLPCFGKPHSSGLIMPGCDVSQQYMSIKFKSFEITTTHPNSCCFLNDGTVVIVRNIIFSTNKNSMVILCQEFLVKENFFSAPLIDSSHIGIHIVKQLSNLCERPLTDIKGKVVLLPFQNNSHVAIKLVHL